MKKALFIRFSSLGDVVLTSVVIDPLRELGYEPYLLTFKPYDQLFEDDPRVKVISTTKEELFKKEFLKKLKEGNFEIIIDLHKNLKTLFLKLFLKGRWLSYNKRSFKRRLTVLLKLFKDERYYVTESYLGALGDLNKKFKPFPKILVSEERLSGLKKLLPESFVVLAPGAKYRKKMYPYFKEVAQILKKEGVDIVWIGSKEERTLCGKEGINLCGKLSLSDLLGVIKLAKVFVGNDSGLLHCARAVKTKAVQIYGATHPSFGFSLYPEEGEVIIKELSCQPCDLHGKGRCKFGDYRCLEIEPKMVAEKVLRLFYS